jgi:hypothetical protein
VGSFAGYGLPLAVPLAGGDGPPELPLSLTVGAWLLRDRPAAPPRSGQAVAATAGTTSCLALGAALADRAARVGLLVMGDGSACRGEKSPGYADPRAEPYDAGVAAALAAVDVRALVDLDPLVSTELLAAGRAPWQVLAGAAGTARFTGRVGYSAAPYGVQYTVATWTAVAGSAA